LAKEKLNFCAPLLFPLAIMNTDVLSNIAAFSDIETRWLMGFGSLPQPLRRNATFDEKLRAIHEYRINRPYVSWPNRAGWAIYLNKRMWAYVYPHGYLHFKSQPCYRHNFIYCRDDEAWVNDFMVMEYKSGTRQLTSNIRLDKPIGEFQFGSVLTEQVNGQWCVNIKREFLSLADCDTLRRLGYKMALATRNSNDEPVQYVKI
jgi:hypothetical protein